MKWILSRSLWLRKKNTQRFYFLNTDIKFKIPTIQHWIVQETCDFVGLNIGLNISNFLAVQSQGQVMQKSCVLWFSGQNKNWHKDKAYILGVESRMRKSTSVDSNVGFYSKFLMRSKNAKDLKKGQRVQWNLVYTTVWI